MYKIRLICNSFTVTIDTLKIGKSASIDDFIGCGLPMIRLISCFSFSKKYIDNYGFLIRFRCSPIPFIQWGNINVGTTDTKVTLPISFSNNAYRVVFTSTWNTEAIGSTLTKEFHNTGRKTTSAFYIKSNYSNAMDWIAIGY